MTVLDEAIAVAARRWKQALDEELREVQRDLLAAQVAGDAEALAALTRRLSALAVERAPFAPPPSPYFRPPRADGNGG